MSAALSLADLVALNDEIVALVRAGVPLERGLAQLAREAPGRLEKLSQRLARGEPLAQALAAERSGLPPLYAAVVEAGLRAGRLPAALEGLAAAARRLDELRRAASVALVYPIIVLLVAYEFILFAFVKLIPALAVSYEDFGSRAAGFMHRLGDFGAAVGPHAQWVPIAIVLGVLVWLWQSSRAVVMEPVWAGRLLGWIPWFGRMRALGQAAAFAEMLALLVEHHTPLDEGLPLAAAATGSRRWQQAAEGWSDARTSYAGCHHDGESPIDADNHGVLFLRSGVRYHEITDGRSNTIFLGEKLIDDEPLIAHAPISAAAGGDGVDRSFYMEEYDPPAIPDAETPPGETPPGEGAVGAIGGAPQEPAPLGPPPTPLPPLSDLGWISGTRATLRNTGTPINESSGAFMQRRKKPRPAAASTPLWVGGFESWHPGGAYFAFGDGAVRYVREQISTSVYQRLGHRSDGGLIDLQALGADR
jgi:hypothetical protein